jgi:hypothetical protein
MVLFVALACSLCLNTDAKHRHMVLSMCFVLYIGSGFLASVRVRWQAADECSILDALDGSSAQICTTSQENVSCSCIFHFQV